MAIDFYQRRRSLQFERGQELWTGHDQPRNPLKNWKNTRKYFIFYVKRMGQMVGENDALIPHLDDPDQILEKTFFQYPSPCGSFILIRADGQYKAMRGEYDDQHMIKLIKSMR